MSNETGGIFKIIIGAAEIVGGALTGNPLLVAAGIGTVISGVGSLVSGDPINHNGISERNPISPWKIGFGLTAPKNNLVYMHQWGSNGQMLDLVMVLYDHPVSAITEVLFDQQRVQIDTTAIPTSANAGFAIPAPAAGSGTSFTPVQQTNIFATSITQSNDVVTIKLPNDIPFLTSGDPIIVKGTSGNTYSAQFSVSQILGRGGAFGALSFTILNGASMPPTVQVSTKWVDYGRTVYYEPLLGNQLLGQTFVGMTAGTPWQGTGKLVTPLSPLNAGTDNQFPAQANPWTPQCTGQSKALVFLRINIGDAKYYPGSGLPLISFRCTGKNNIYDPRLGPCTGVKVAGLTAAGSGYQVPALYGAYDVLTLVQGGASGGQISVTGINGAGAITSYVVTNPGTGYSTGACTVTGGHGSGATFAIQVLGGAAGTVGYTANPALCIADFCADQKWGYKYNYGTDIPLPQLIAAANVCDQQVTLAEGGTEPLWSCNGQFEMTTRRGETLQNLLTSCAGRITPEPPFTIQPAAWYGSGLGTVTAGGTMSGYVVGDVIAVVQTGAIGGQITVTSVSGGSITGWEIATVGTEYFLASALATTGGSGTGATVTINALAASLVQDLQAIAAGPYQWKGPTVHELYNACKGTYISPDNKWQSTDYPYYAQDSMHGYSGPSQYQGDINLAADGGDRRFFELNLPFTISSRQAQQTAKVELLRRRWANRGVQSGIGQGGIGTFLCNMAAYAHAPLDVFAGTVAFLGISAQTMEVTTTRLTLSQKEGGVALGISLDVQLTDSSIYAWSTVEELTPQGYVQSTFPTGQAPETNPWPWSPGYVAPLPGDAIYPQASAVGSPPTYTGIGPASFGLQTVYGGDAGGNGIASLQIKGTPPAGALDTGIANPLIVCTASTTGGSIPLGTFVVGLAARDSGSSIFAYSDFQSLGIVSTFSGTATLGANSIVVTPTWGPGDDGGDLYVAVWNQNGYVFHYNQTLSSGQTSATITSLIQSTPGGPDPMFDHFGVLWLQEIHGGLWAQQVQAVTATTITIADLSGMTPANLYTGYTISLLGKYDPNSEVIILNMPVASNTSSGGSPPANEFVLTIGPNSAGIQLPDLTTLLAVGDLLVMRDKATFTSNSFSDPNIANVYFPGGATGVEAGHVAIVMTGADQGDMQTVESVSGTPPTQFNISGNWAITPAAGDIVAICAPATSPEVPSASFSIPNTASGGVVVSTVTLPNLPNQTWLVLVRTETQSGAHGPDSVAPMRDIYQFGAGGTRVA